VERADLAKAIAEAAARYENAKEAVFSSSLGEVRSRTRHVKRLNAHTYNPAGFERALEAMVAAVRAYLARGADELLPLVEDMDPSETERLSDKLRSVAPHAMSLPDPPTNTVHRKVAELGEKIERVIHDESTAWHPGVEQIEESEPAESANR
jgi:hypothetical protein